MARLIQPGGTSTSSSYRTGYRFEPAPPSREERKLDRQHRKVMSLLEKGIRRSASTKVRYAKKIIGSDLRQQGRTTAYSLLMRAIVDRPNEKIWRNAFEQMALLCDYEIERIDTDTEDTVADHRDDYIHLAAALRDTLSPQADYEAIAERLREHRRSAEFSACAMACYYLAAKKQSKPELLDKAVDLVIEAGFLPKSDVEPVLAPYKSLAVQLRAEDEARRPPPAPKPESNPEQPAPARNLPPLTPGIPDAPLENVPAFAVSPVSPRLKPAPPPRPKVPPDPTDWRAFAIIGIVLITIAAGLTWYKITEDARKAQEAFAEGTQHFAAGQYEQAVDRYRKAVDLDGDFIDARISLGNANLALGRTAVAEIRYDEAIAADPKAAMAYFARGKLNWLVGVMPAAAADMKVAAELQPGNRLFHIAYGDILSQLNDLKAAEELFKHAAQANPGADWPIWGWLGYIAADFARSDDLLSAIAEIEKSGGASSPTDFYRGIVSMRQKKWLTAVKQFEAAIARSPDGVALEAYQHAASAYFELGNQTACRNLMKQYASRAGITLRTGICTKP